MKVLKIRTDRNKVRIKFTFITIHRNKWKKKLNLTSNPSFYSILQYLISFGRPVQHKRPFIILRRMKERLSSNSCYSGVSEQAATERSATPDLTQSTADLRKARLPEPCAGLRQDFSRRRLLGLFCLRAFHNMSSRDQEHSGLIREHITGNVGEI
ncbi:hypothetical protein NQD34_017725 [Periophthalmus magnuspinnatus]|nr:hypothetical protein NQD34_017725 [Periophthalmus magnuspinnatus]